MFGELTIGAVIPARDEQENIAAVIHGLRELKSPNEVALIDDIVVCDNNSSDDTALHAKSAGARVVSQSTAGYGIACLTAIAALRPVDVIVFIDGDQAFDLHQTHQLLNPIANGADLVIGSRMLGLMEPGALSLPQIVGNRVAGLLIRLIWHQRVTDLGPFRAIRTQSLTALQMVDQAYGWTVEMQVKAIQQKMRIVEIPVNSLRRRHGQSKIGGTIKGVVGASIGILSMILKLALNPPHNQHEKH